MEELCDKKANKEHQEMAKGDVRARYTLSLSELEVKK